MASTAEWFNAQARLRQELERVLETRERNKTEKEREIIGLVDRATNSLLEKYGLPPLFIGADHIHLLPPPAYQRLYPEGMLGAGRYSLPYQAILFSDRGPDDMVEFALTLFHEMVHFKFWNALQVTDPNERLQTYRTGIAVVSRDGKELYLSELNEAITEDLTGEFFDTILQEHPLFADEIAQHNKTTRGYAKERADFHALLRTLSEGSGGRHSNAELRDLFIRAAATGDLLPISRIVERTLGSGSFRLLSGPPKNIDYLPGIALTRE